MKWKILHSGVESAQNNMDIDQKLLHGISCRDCPLLRFYDWEGPSATYGYFINPLNYLEQKGIEKMRLQLGRRPTGGGIVFHLTDLAFSVIIPASHPAYSLNTLDNYAFINRQVARAVVNFKKETSPILLQTDKKAVDSASSHFCMAKPTIYDVMVEGKKVGGAAQRRARAAFLHQGTISITMPDDVFLAAVLKPENQVLEAMKSHTYMLMASSSNGPQLKEAREELRRLLTLEFASAF